MMAAFNVSVLADLNHTDTTRFIDPMEPLYRAKSFSDSDLVGRTGNFSDGAIQAKVNFFAGLDAYAHEPDAESALVAYWATHTAGVATLVTSTTGQGGSLTTPVSSSATTKTSQGSSAATTLITSTRTTSKSSSSSTRTSSSATKT